MYPNDIDKFTEKLNKVDGNTYVIEEEVNLKDSVYEGELEHDNVSNSSVRVYTGPKLTGDKIENFILSTPSVTPWKREIKIFGNLNKAYITYETPGDTVEAEDINKIQESIVNTQKEVNKYKGSNDLEIGNLKVRTTNLENKKAEKTYVDTELNKRYLKEQVFTKEEVLQKIEDIIGTAPEALDTLQEIAKALNNDADFAGTMTNELSKKVDKVVGKQLSTEDYTTVEKNKLAGVEQGANKYIHPSTHSADIIVENLNKRFVSDTEKANWNAKETPTGAQAKADNALKIAKEYTDTHDSNEVKHIIVTERANWNEAYTKRHEHSNKSILDKITQVLLDSWDSAVTHISDSVRHITASERTSWNTVSNKVDKVTGKGLSTNDFDNNYKGKVDGIATGSTKVENSVTNGNIKINGVEANVYTHPSGTNPHGTTKSDVGLSNVDNTKQATKTEFDAHAADSVKHITAAERAAWNVKSDKTYVDTELAKKQNKLSYTPVNKAGDTMTGQLVIDGAAADRPLVVRGISGSSATGSTPDTLHLNYDSDKTVAVGSSSAILLDPLNKKITVNGGAVWHANNFNPSTKSDVGHTHDDRYYTETEADSKFATKDELGSAGYGDMLKSVYDKNNNGKVDTAETADSVPWAGVTGKPSTFSPSTHTHAIANVTGLQSALDGKMNKGSITWNQLKGV
ncbi:MAG: hypothetical protein AB2417_02525 [Clostridiaceae bacterium]